MTKLKTVNVIRHLAFEDLASFESVLEINGYGTNYIEAADFSLKPDDLAQLDPLSDELLVILGGPISVNDTALFQFIDAEVNMLSERLIRDKPTLGICLGAQFIARALGSTIYVGKEKEIGWSKITFNRLGRTVSIADF